MRAELKTRLAAANALYREGKFAEAEQHYSEILAENPENAGVLMHLGELALWKNRPAEAENYLQRALAHTSGLKNIWPFNMQIKNLLAMAYYRGDNFPQAARFFAEAAGPFGFPPFNSLQIMGKQLALFGSDSPYHIEGAETTRIPFVITDPLPVVEASVNDSEPLRVRHALPGLLVRVVEASVNDSEPLLFLIDTGGADLILDTGLAHRLGARFAGTLRGAGGSTRGQLGLGKIDRMKLGDITIHHVPIHSLNTQPIAAGFDNLPIKGIIGTRLLLHFLATIDYPDACLTLRPKTAAFQPQNARAIPFHLVQTHYIIAEGAINGTKPTCFFVDTGLGGQGFSVSEAALRDLGIVVDWSVAKKGVAGFGDTLTAPVTADCVALGNNQNRVIARNLPGIVFKKPFEVLGYRLGFYIGGVVSHLFFRDYALTLDFVGMQLFLQGG
jgi:predicted aspartyl protease